MFGIFGRIAPLPPAFVYTVHKAGSMFLHELCAEVAPRLGLEAVSKNDPAYFDKIDEKRWAGFIDAFPRTNGCFGPIRVNTLGAPTKDGRVSMEEETAGGEAFAARYWPKAAAGGSVVVHGRDPRDMLTSLFYSVAHSHAAVPGNFDPAKSREPVREEGIDAYVLRMAAGVGARYRMIQEGLLGRPGVTVVRYEEMVTRFDGWLGDFLAGITRAHVPEREDAGAFQKRLQRVHAWAYGRHRDDFRVEGEDVRRHKRQVLPGDHRQKLRAETIAQLNGELADVLGAFGYE